MKTAFFNTDKFAVIILILVLNSRLKVYIFDRQVKYQVERMFIFWAVEANPVEVNPVEVNPV